MADIEDIADMAEIAVIADVVDPADMSDTGDRSDTPDILDVADVAQWTNSILAQDILAPTITAQTYAFWFCDSTLYAVSSMLCVSRWV